MSTTMIPGVSPSRGMDYGNKIYEMTRRRLASGTMGQGRQLASLFASRGGVGSSASIASARELEKELMRQTTDASIRSQLEGTRLDQFDRELAQRAALTREGYSHSKELARLNNVAMMERLLAEQKFRSDLEKRQSKYGLFSSLGQGLGSLAAKYLLPTP